MTTMKLRLTMDEYVALRMVLQHRVRNARFQGSFEALLRKVLWKMNQTVNERRAA